MKGLHTIKCRGDVAAVIGLLAILASTGVEAQRWGRPTAPRAGACFYRDVNFQGDYFCVDAGQDVAQVSRDMNDQISSIRIFGNTQVLIFQDLQFRGQSARFGRDVRNLTDEGWNDRLTSIRVRNSSGSSRNTFGGGARARAEDIVRHAYLSVFGREPDPASEGWVDRVLRDRWTEEDVARELRKSDEFRNRRR